MTTRSELADRDIAIVGMSLRFPGAETVEEFWQNLRNGVESISFFSEEELRAAGTSAAMLADPNFVRAQPALKHVDEFDAAFFGFKPREAEAMDPQLRVFLECAWEALEHAGYDPETAGRAVSVYAGNNISNYFIFNLLPILDVLSAEGSLFGLVSYNDKDALATVVSHKLNLRGPSVSVQTFCSTSLVAVHLACQGLLAGESDLALAGGVSISGQQVAGYLFEEGGIKSPDGHNRSFDARGQGTVFGNGAGVVVLKRLADALADGDTIHAVIRGSAVNNDGSQKAGYTAPSVDGQAGAIGRALQVSGVNPETIGYIETHGTATSIGDPIEVQGMTKAFRVWTAKKQFCPIGSVKSNFGHLDRAAGVAGLIKAALALEHRQIPPSLHFETPNPKIDFENSPFYVNTTLRDFPCNGAPRRAGVSSLGIGGTNAHVIVEEAPEREGSGPSRNSQLLVLSARSEAAVARAGARLGRFLQQHREAPLADVAFTLSRGRRAFAHRLAVVGSDADEVVTALESRDRRRVWEGTARAGRAVGFLLPGQGTQYVQMGRGLYERERVFRDAVDRASRVLQTVAGWDLRAVLYPDAGEAEAAREQLRQTAVTQPAVFVVGYALAQQWAAWGVRPAAMLGHSLGEYVAACLAGVMELEEALRLVALRGSMMQALPPGVMLAVGLPEREARRYESETVSLATINAPEACVLAGPPEAMAELEARLTSAGIGGRRLETSHAFHSSMMDPMLAPFGEAVAKLTLRPPSVPYVSNVTGRWITAEEATDPRYWVRHVRDAVRFADGVATLLEDEERMLLEVGAGKTLSGLVRRHPASADRPPVVASLRAAHESTDDVAALQAAAAQLWTAGADIDWAGYWAGEGRRRLPLPTYPFERQRYWIEPAATRQPPQKDTPAVETPADLADWFYMPAWKRSAAPAPFQGRTGRTDEPGWLVLVDEGAFGSALVRQLQGLGERVVAVAAGDAFQRLHETYFTVRAAERDDWTALVRQLDEEGLMPGRVLSLWNLVPQDVTASPLDRFDVAQERGFFALLAMAQALGDRQLAHPIHVGVVTNQLQNVTGEATRAPERATVLGPCKVMPQEYADLSCVAIDVVLPEAGGPQERELGAALLAEMASPSKEAQVAYRGGHRWALAYERTRVERAPRERVPIRDGGVYLITGGLGGLGLVLASHLAETVHAKLVLVQRSALPPEEAWDDWLASHDESDRTSRRIRRVRELVAKGGDVLVVSADAADEGQMRAAIDRATGRFGPINGVLHAAGVAGDGVMQLKTRAVAGGVIAPKVRGGLVLDAIFRGRPLDFMVLFSSVASVTGGFGQVDYCGANSFLDVLANGHQATGGWPMIAVNWDAWSEVGMAVETVQRPTAVPGRAAPAAFEPIVHPYFDRRLVNGAETRYVGRFSPERIWFLNEHRLFQQPTLPSTAYLELARSVYAPLAGGAPFELRDVFFLTPFAVPLGEARDLELVLMNREGEHEFVIRSQAADGRGWQEHCRGRLVPAPDAQPRMYDLPALERSCADREIVNPPVAWSEMEGQIFKAGGHLDLGPRWYNMERILFGQGRELGIQALPEAIAGDVETAALHPALLDFTALLPLETEGIYIPFSFDCVRVLAPLPPRLCTWVVNRDDLMAGKETVQFDASLMDRTGRGLVEIEGMTLRRIDRLRSAATGAAPVSAGSPAPSVPADRPLPDAPNVHVAMSAPGLFSNLELRPAARRAPGPGEVEIEVAAAGLNFKDVLRALGMIPDMPGGTVDAGFGAECAGRIAAVGPGVSGFEAGDEVMAIAPGAFSAFTVTGAPLVVPIPSGLSYEQAAVVPLVFLTAYHALVNQARLQAGERVLIHAAAGGVGLAAIQIAQHIGAEIYATAGSPAKREYLSSLGVRHVSTSRALSFVEDIRSWTQGEGVDVVLNSLSGEFIPASLGLLRAYGRFVEIGARDIYQNSPLGLRPFANNLSLSAIDLGPMFVQRPHAVHRMFEQIAAHFEAGEYQPEPVQSFPIAAIEEAFEFMAGARQIGKLALHVQTLARRQPARRPAAGSAAGAAANGMIPPREGIDAFERALAARRPQLVVSPKNLRAVIDWQRQALRTLQDTAQPAATVQTRVQHPRPELATAFAAPRTDAEQQIAAIWRDLLGLTEVGIHDSFFELGGDSLIGVQVLSRIKKAFNVQLPSSVLYEGPTVESLARLVGGEDVDESAAFAQRRGRAERRRERQPRRHGDS